MAVETSTVLIAEKDKNQLATLEHDTIKAIRRGGEKDLAHVRANLDEAFRLGFVAATPAESRLGPRVANTPARPVGSNYAVGDRVQWMGLSGIKTGAIVAVIPVGQIPQKHEWPSFYEYGSKPTPRQVMSYVVEVQQVCRDARYMWPLTETIKPFQDQSPPRGF